MYIVWGCIHSCGVWVRVGICVLYGLGWRGLVGHQPLTVLRFAASEKEKTVKKKKPTADLDCSLPGLSMLLKATERQ